MDNFIKYLVAIMGTIAGIIVLVLIFTACWCVKQRRLAIVGDSGARLYGARPMPSPNGQPKFEQGIPEHESQPVALSPESRISGGTAAAAGGGGELRQRQIGNAAEQPTTAPVAILGV